MAEPNTSLETNEKISRQAPQLVAVLKEMKEGLDTVTSKVQVLTAKVKAGHFPTPEGISYLETKHLLLLNYCQSLVYYLLRKAKGEHYQATVRRDMREVDWRKLEKDTVGRKEDISPSKGLAKRPGFEIWNEVYKNLEILHGSDIRSEKHVMFI